MPTRSAAAFALTAVALLGACSGDDGGPAEAATSTSSLDPGVTFDNDVTIPSTVVGGTTTTAAPGEVETTPRQVPADFPQGFPVPDDAVVEVGSTGSAEGERRVAVDYSIADTDPADTFAFYQDALADSGANVLLHDADGDGQDFIGQLVFETDTFVGNVLVSGDGESGVLLTLTATIPD